MLVVAIPYLISVSMYIAGVTMNLNGAMLDTVTVIRDTSFILACISLAIIGNKAYNKELIKLGEKVRGLFHKKTVGV